MTTNGNSKREQELRGVEAALRRAALKARALAEATNTPFIVLRDGKIVDLVKEAAEVPERKKQG